MLLSHRSGRLLRCSGAPVFGQVGVPCRLTYLIHGSLFPVFSSFSGSSREPPNQSMIDRELGCLMEPDPSSNQVANQQEVDSD